MRPSKRNYIARCAYDKKRYSSRKNTKVGPTASNNTNTDIQADIVMPPMKRTPCYCSGPVLLTSRPILSG